MFTGIIEEKGTVKSLQKNATSGVWTLQIATTKVSDGIAIGDSVAVNGTCLTVVNFDKNSLSFDVLDETLRKTSFNVLRENSGVNLERAVTPSSRMGGHFVTGHIDGVGEVLFFGQEGANFRLRVRPPAEFSKYLVYKGSVAVDGVSLTVADVQNDTFDIWLIPHTLEETNLSERKSGEPVNLEFDILAKYVERFTQK